MMNMKTKSAHPKNTASKPWFIAVRHSYLPASQMGMLIYALYTTYLVVLSVSWYHRGHGAWEFLTTVIPLSILASAVAQYIASKNS